jgi:hypothetical protein
VPAQLVVDDRLHLRVETETAVAFGEVHPGETVVVLFAAEGVLVDLVRIDLFQQRARALAQLLLAHFDVCHRCLLSF